MAVDPNHHVPIYEQIVEHICGSVTAGVFLPGEVLPSIRALAIELVKRTSVEPAGIVGLGGLVTVLAGVATVVLVF